VHGFGSSHRYDAEYRVSVWHEAPIVATTQNTHGWRANCCGQMHSRCVIANQQARAPYHFRQFS